VKLAVVNRLHYCLHRKTKFKREGTSRHTEASKYTTQTSAIRK
jgi:hypothetical protein